ncbi:uncharacterized protein KY384_004306 [Bacidia gigantensis]|uniref:uncharacterized protein n=1 Tax=Bacidia gigantensis TaxID=2732470 RepID=UPI001D04E606|nr:uncharacterized protein KY384_004306 [Bacidia gigantensis]KAG8530949.1 hypothetical protein KY384_004306 [Bacidia gigantensis]
MLITPGDHIYQSFQAGELYRIIIVAGVYILTFTLAIFLYAARLFSTRSALANIPREWNLAGDGKQDAGIGLGMGRSIGRLVRQSWERSAIVAYEGTPRDLKGEEQAMHIPSKKKNRGLAMRDERQGSIDGTIEPVWGVVRHSGWAGPESPWFPNLHFEPVIAELTNIIEAKAVSLAPEVAGDESDDIEQVDQQILDSVVVELVRRPSSMPLRDYVAQLSSIGIFGQEPPVQPVTEFINLYEQARFSDEPLHENQFRLLMVMLNEILDNMQPPDQAMVGEIGASETAETSYNVVTDDSTDDQLPRPGTPRVFGQLVRSEASRPSTAIRSDAQVTAYTSQARRSRSISNMSIDSGSTSASVVHNKPSSLQISSRSGSVSPSNTASSEATASGSVVWKAEGRTSLELPHAFNGGEMNG